MKKRRQVEDAISAASLAILNEFLPTWNEKPPDAMSDAERRTFDLITEFERLATQKVGQVLIN